MSEAILPDFQVNSAPLIVVGMNGEAKIARRLGRVKVGTAGLDSALSPRPEVVISFGICAGLDPALKIGDVVVGTGVVGPDGVLNTDAAWRARLERSVGGRLVLIAGTETVLDSSKQKADLRARTGAVTADMESLAAATAASRADVPFAILRVVSDGVTDDLPRSAVAGFRTDGRIDIPAVLANLASRPWEMPALVRTGLNAATAMRALAVAADRVLASRRTGGF